MGSYLVSGVEISQLGAGFEGDGEGGAVGPRAAVGDHAAIETEDIDGRVVSRMGDDEGVPRGDRRLGQCFEHRSSGGEVTGAAVSCDKASGGVRAGEQSGENHEGVSLANDSKVFDYREDQARPFRVVDSRMHYLGPYGGAE